MALTKVANTLLDFTGGFVAGNVSFPAITTVGDTNTGIYFPAADTIAFAEGGAEAMRIDSSGNVGIGTASPGARLQVVSTASSGVYGAIIYNQSATGQGLTVRGGSTSSEDTFNCQTYDGGLALFTVLGNGNVVIPTGTLKTVSTISVGNATPSTSGAGITFPATQSASTDANTLDDYEEGTYTPTFTSMTVNSGSAVYFGKYTKIGNLCYAMFGTTGTQNVTAVQGLTQFSLPFVSSGINFSAGLGSGPGLAQNGNTTATSGLQGPTNGASGGYFIQGLAATNSIVGSITYQTA